MDDLRERLEAELRSIDLALLDAKIVFGEIGACSARNANATVALATLREVLAHLDSKEAGRVSVPREPTEAMTEAGDLFFTNQSFISVSPAQINAIYRAMLSAAPAQDVPNDASGTRK